MADDTEYISDLDPVLELAPTDSFPVETLEGTKRIMFKDFILGPDNVSFYEEVAADSIAIVALSSYALSLESSITNINSGLTGLSAAYNEAIKSGFCYVTLDTTGTLFNEASSSNIASIILTDGGSRIQITTTGNFNLDNASIVVTLDNSISASDSTEDFNSYLPIIDSRTANSFKVGVTTVNNHFVNLNLPTSITAPTEVINPVTSLQKVSVPVSPVTSITTTTQSVMLNPSGTGDVIKTVSYATSTDNFLTDVVPNSTPKSVVTSATVSTTAYNFMISNNLGDGVPLRDAGINISFRYR